MGGVSVEAEGGDVRVSLEAKERDVGMSLQDRGGDVGMPFEVEVEMWACLWM